MQRYTFLLRYTRINHKIFHLLFWQRGSFLPPVISTGLEYDELYELSNRAAEKYIRDNLRGNYLNTDTGDVIRITRKGAEKVTRHDAESHVHLKSIALIPELIRRSVFIAEVKNEKQVNITPIEKKKLLKSIDEIKRTFASKESSDDGEQVSDVLSHCKDKRLISILQGNS